MEGKTVLEYLNDKIRFFEKGIEELKSEIAEIEKNPPHEKIGRVTTKGIDIEKLLRCDKYRLEVAIKLSVTGTNKELAELLNTAERTVYRKRNQYNL